MWQVLAAREPCMLFESFPENSHHSRSAVRRPRSARFVRHSLVGSPPAVDYAFLYRFEEVHAKPDHFPQDKRKGGCTSSISPTCLRRVETTSITLLVAPSLLAHSTLDGRPDRGLPLQQVYSSGCQFCTVARLLQERTRCCFCQLPKKQALPQSETTSLRSDVKLESGPKRQWAKSFFLNQTPSPATAWTQKKGTLRVCSWPSRRRGPSDSPRINGSSFPQLFAHR